MSSSGSPKSGSSSSGKGKGKAKSSAAKAAPIAASPYKIGRVSHPAGFQERRVRTMTKSGAIRADGKCVIYWMSRDQRAEENWALLLARHLAQEKGLPLAVCFNLVPRFSEATIRQYGFMIRGLKETDAALSAKRIPLYLVRGEPQDTVPALATKLQAAAVVTDLSPLRVPLAWVSQVATALEAQGGGTPLFQVDAHNVVPVWEASPKLEVGARTIRKKIHDQLPDYLVPFPEAGLAPNADGHGLPPSENDWDDAMAKLEVNREVKEVAWLKPGSSAGKAMVEEFIEQRLKDFGDKRNDPTVSALSNLSPYFHFGQVSVQAVVLRLKQVKRYHESVQSFIEEAVVRRELADNFCFYQPNYDSLEGAAGWAKETLETHSADPRAFIYSLEQLEQGKTHDKLWNAAQLQMVNEGKMHGFLRMYWAKKILEWTDTPANALKYSIFLNDKYELDGRDPNGYVGCAWSIMGTHDMGWAERTIFGKIRYMNYDGCKRKFNVDAFCARYPQAVQHAKATGKSGMDGGSTKKRKAED